MTVKPRAAAISTANPPTLPAAPVTTRASPVASLRSARPRQAVSPFSPTVVSWAAGRSPATGTTLPTGSVTRAAWVPRRLSNHKLNPSTRDPMTDGSTPWPAATTRPATSQPGV